MNHADDLKNYRGSLYSGPDPRRGGALVPVLRGGRCVCVVACVGLSLLAILCLLAGQTTGCIAMFVLAFLVSPFGLPALGGWLVERLYGVKYAAMDFMAS